MGVYFNPNNESFTQARTSMIYVDKTSLLEVLNRRLKGLFGIGIYYRYLTN